MSPSEGGSSYEVNAHFEKTLALVRELEAEMARLTAQGDEVRASQTQARIAALKGPTGGLTVAEVDETTGAIQRENAALAETLQKQLAVLDAMRLQARQATVIAELNRRATPELIVPTGPRYTSYGQTAGGQVETEARLTAENTAREKGLALELELLDIERQRVREMKLYDAELAAQEKGYAAGVGAAAQGRLVPQGERSGLSSAPAEFKSGEWTEANAALVRYNVSLGEYDRFAAEAKLQTDALDASLLRTGMAASESSNALRRHGALTTEWITALVHGDTTLSELGYQLGATTAKFGGWVAAAGATYAALGGVVEIGKGAIDSSTGVQRLQRTIEGLDTHKAAAAIQQVSRDANVPIKESADAIFQFSRTFHNVDDAATAASLALRAYQLDGVQVADSVKAATALHQQFGVSAQGLVPVFDQLAQGQQKFNARLSEQIPLLQRSAASVKNAGGDLTTFLALSTVALRTTQLSGSQLGTIFQRSAANFLSPNTTKGQADLGVLRGLGIDTNVFGKGQGGFTKLLEEMLAISPRLSDADRGKMAAAFAGPQLGGRAAGLFAGSSDALLKQVQDQLKHSQGTLGTEFTKEAHTARQEMASFVNGLQRLGAAFGDTGAMQAFGFALHGIVSGFDELRGVIDAFNQLPAAAREAITGVVAFRAGMLLLNRTRFGASIPGSKFLRIPGLDPSHEEQKQRAGLARGGRQAINQVEQDLASTTARSVQISAQQAALARQRASIEKQITAEGGETEVSMNRRNAIDAKLAALDLQLIAVETERTAQYETLAALKSQQVALTSSRFSSKHMGGEDVGALNAAAGAEEANAAALVGGTAAEQRLASAQRTRAGLLRLQKNATVENTAALQAQVVAADEEIAAAEAAAAETEVAAGRMAAMATAAKSFVLGLDPLLVALIGIPIAYSAIKDALDSTSKANQAARDALNPSTIASSTLGAQADALRAAAKQQAGSGFSGGLTGLAQKGFSKFLEFGTDLETKGQAEAEASQQRAQLLDSINTTYQHMSKRFNADAVKLLQTDKGRKQLDQEQRHFEQVARVELQGEGFSPGEVTAIYNKLVSALKGDRDGAVAAAANRSDVQDYFSQLAHMTNAQLGASVQTLSDRADVFGLSGGDTTKATEAYLRLASRIGKDPNASQKDLQALKAAQQAIVTAVNKNITDLQHAADTATTSGGQQAAEGQEVNTIENAKVRLAAAVTFDSFFTTDKKKLASLRDAERTLNEAFDEKLAPALQAIIDGIKSQGDFAASQVRGFSPEADITRAEDVLNALQQAVAKAHADNAGWKVLGPLLTELNNKENELAKLKIDDARSILQAQGGVAAAAIGGSGPSADIARSQQAVANAAQLLSFDQSHGAGKAQLLQDQASLLDAQRSFNQQLQQRNQQLAQNLAALNDAEAKLAESQTRDPVAQARDELNAAQKNLALIKPQDYQSQTEYLTALTNAKSAVNDSRNKVQDAIVQQDLDNLKFEHDINRIGDQAYISGLRQILSSKKLSLAERHQILEEIYHLTHDSTQPDLNVGSIKLPSVYEIRRAIGLGKRGEIPGSGGTVINHSATVTVNVYGPKGAAAVGAALDHHLGTSVNSAMRAKGLV